jgi:uncharacterized protein DUF6496
MPDPETIERAQEDAREGKSASTQAGEFVKEEIDHVREGKHGVRSAKQAIAIGLSKARRAGVKLPPPKTGKAATRQQASRDSAKGQSGARRKPSAKRSRATTSVLKKEGRSGASREAFAKHARASARQRGAAARKRSAGKAVQTKKREAAARKPGNARRAA